MPDEQKPSLIADVSNEAMIVGALFNNPQIYEEYYDLISSEYDFSDPSIKFCYNLLLETYMNHSVVNDTSLNITLSKMSEEDKEYYKSLGGFRVYERLGGLAKTQSDFKKLYETLKLFNVLRYLSLKGYPVEKHVDKFKGKNVEFVLKTFELSIHKAGAFVRGVSDGEAIAKGMVNYYKSLLETPDVGIPLYCRIISNEIRGLRLGTLRAIGAATNKGKSRYVCRELMDLAIIKQVPVLLIINETTVAEFRLQMLTCVVNNIIGKKYGVMINESKIAVGDLTDKEKAIVLESAEYIEKYSKLIVYETYIYDAATLKMTIRKYQLREKVEHFYIDIYKAFRSLWGQHMSEWQVLAEGANQLKQMCVELKIHITFTMQIQTSTDSTGVLNVDAIQGAKQIANFCDTVIMIRELKYKEKMESLYQVMEEGNPFFGQRCGMNPHDCMYAFKLVKNRSGRAGSEVVFRVQKGELIFDEKGILVISNN